MDMYKAGLDEGLDNELDMVEDNGAAADEKRPKRRPFHIWTVDGQEYKLKLTTQMIGMLERKYRTNILNLITADGLPQLSVMLTVIQAAASPWSHGMDYERVKKLYDLWREEGGSQMDLLSKVVMPVMVVSGFFTEKQGGFDHGGLDGNGGTPVGHRRITDVIDDIYPEALEAGIPAEKFWDMSFGEVVDSVKAYNQRLEREFKNSVRLRFLQAELTTRYLTLEEHMPVPQPWDYYPELFKDEAGLYEKAVKEEEMERFKERRRQYAAALDRQLRASSPGER